MKRYKYLDIKKIEYNTVSKYSFKDKKTTIYLNLECAFDIETTSTYINKNEKFAFMYEWTFGVGKPDWLVYGRTWEEFLNLCKELKKFFSLSEDRILIIYVHNLAYEFQFMRKYFNWLSVFSVDDRKPIKALCDFGIEFRDSYILSGYSLEKLADNLVTHKIEKLVGDLDYKLVRNSKTFLSNKELKYCENDVLIVLYYINEQIMQYGDITKIPLTNTGRVRQFVRRNCLSYNKSHKHEGQKGKIERYRNLMQECVLDKDTYVMLKRCFMGGFTHASMSHVMKLLYNVSSIDFTSSYPYVMLSEKFPMSKPIKVNLQNEDFWELYNNENVGLMFDLRLTNVHSKNTYESYLSESKCFKKTNVMINNGRIFSADEIITTVTDIDLKIIKACYTFDAIQVTNVYKFHLQYLPKQIILSILELYGKKTTLKGVSEKEVEYLISKGMLNSVYGMCVTDIIRGMIEYCNGEWKKEEITEKLIDEQIEKYNNGRNRFLYYAWGVWVTAYARKNLWTGILNIGDDYIYSDTDSIKFLNYEKHLDFINEYNKQVEYKLKVMCINKQIDFNLCKPKTIKGTEKLIGVWDYEGTYNRFKTLGAKRYMYEIDNKIHITIAGLSKQNGAKYLEEITKNDNTKIFNLFNDDLYIPANKTGKNTHTYIDDEMCSEITDYQGNKELVTSLSSIHLSECDFTLSLAKEYSKFLDNLSNGYLYAGSKYL